ncbi:ATP-grasp fold amidoligase family protein [Brachyspira hyodysenteriae]|uniref:ATP-grasp fold amidoligase family protein n=1 Tax=Brachyspira hyodysenteriae TaxID=159 RepID=UPI000A162475|nr:ATP-grasp fold amidoligase family protein [Brachyspira hyodysenteriae]
MTKEENIRFREKIIKEQFRNALGYELNLENPKTFNEKLQWLKLYYHDPLMTICADKYAVREYIKETIGEEYLIPLIGVWDKVEDIDFNSLPNQFVLKVNWGSGQNIIVKDKSTLNIEEIKKKLEYWMKPTSNHYYYSYEWCYKNIKPKIIAEKYIEQSDGNLTDYKVYCFNGNIYFIGLYLFRNTNNYQVLYYNKEFKKLEFEWGSKNTNKNDIVLNIKKLEKIFILSSLLCKKFIHIRVDFFITDHNIYLGELTFFDGSGYEKFNPIKWDYKFGELLELPKEKKLEYDFIDRDTLINQANNLEPIVKQYRDLEEDYNKLKPLEEKIKLYSKKFNLFTIFNIDILSFTSNKEYFILTILGIKIVFKHKVRSDQIRSDNYM